MKGEKKPLLAQPAQPRESTLSDGGEVHTGYGAYNAAVLSSIRRPQSFIGPKTKRTWDGVFLPVSLSVFGVVLFIRLPWIVGECGLWLTLLSIALCYTVTGLTTISLAAISTNGFTGDGGPYMMVSRSLGPQIGLNIGIIFVLSNIIASAMYLVGGADVIVQQVNSARLLEAYQNHEYLVLVGISSAMLLTLLGVASFKVEKWFRLLSLVVTLVAVLDVFLYVAINPDADASTGYTGFKVETLKQNWSPSFTGANTYPKVLSVLFPGVTGLMSGVCLSGELAHGAKAIPRGIGYAWLLSLVTYTTMAVVIAGVFDRSMLQSRFRTLQSASHVYVFLPGEISSTFAAVLAGLVGSSRVMKAMAKDGLIPNRLFRAVSRMSNYQAILIVWGLIQLQLFLGDQYQIASMFASQGFLANFMALNLSTFLTAATSLPSFRPMYAFFNEVTALVGALLCCVVMFTLSPIGATIVLVLVVAMLTLFDAYIDGSRVAWGDASQPLVFYLVRKWLLRLDERKEHIKHWRPSIIQIVTDPLCSLNLMHLANNLKKGGLYELALVVGGDFDQTAEACFRWKGWLMDFIAASGIKAFPVVTFGTSLRIGVQYLLRSAGLGGMHPNTVLLSLDELLMKDAFDDFYASYHGEGFSFQTTHSAAVYSNAFAGHSAFEAPLPASYTKYGSGDDSSAGGAGTPVVARSVNAASPLTVPSSRTGDVAPPLRRRSGRLSGRIAAPDSASDSGADATPYEVESFVRSSTASNGARAAVGAALRSSLQSAAGANATAAKRHAHFADIPVVEEVTTTASRGDASNVVEYGSNDDDDDGSSDDELRTRNGSIPLGSPAGSQSTHQHGHRGDASYHPHHPRHAAHASTAMAADSAGRWGSPSPPAEEAPHHHNQHINGGSGGPIMIHSYRSYRRKDRAWRKFFMSNRTANEGAELKQVEKMVEQRHKAKIFGTPDLAAYHSLRDFVNVVRDINRLNMTVIIARGIDKLDKHEIKEATSQQFIDVWNPEEDDPILFLMAHTLHLTSVWKRHTQMRIISVVSYCAEEEDEKQLLTTICKEHRIRVKEIVVLSLERQLPAYFRFVLEAVQSIGVTVPPAVAEEDAESQLDWIELLMEQKHGRALVMNALMRHADLGNGCVGTAQTALAMIRIDVPKRRKTRRTSLAPQLANASPTSPDGGSFSPKHENLDEFLKMRRSMRRSARLEAMQHPHSKQHFDDTHHHHAHYNDVATVHPGEGGEALDDDEEGERWLDDTCRLSENLPPVLMVQGGSLKCKSSDW